MTLPADIAHHQRRTAAGGEVHMAQPPIIAFGCEYYIEPET
jgi:hypothetical protein